jgi:membrane-bound serine protease (ClpP class)
MDSILWMAVAIFLFIVCAVVLVLEVFVPSFGLLTVMALGALAGGIMICFEFGPITGWIGSGVAAVVIPIVWYACYRLIPRTGLGKVLILQKVERPRGDAISDNVRLQGMLHRAGRVITPLRPVGMCDFDGKRLECVSETGYVERDKQVEVIRVEGTQLTVRVIGKEE